MTLDVSARDVVCDVGSTKGEEVEGGGHPLCITFHFRTLHTTSAHPSNFQNHSIFKVKILFNTINSYMGNLRYIVFIHLERNIYIEKVLKFVDLNRNDICCIYAAYPNDYT